MKKAPKLYLARAGRNGEDEELALENNLAIIDFRDIPSLKGVANYEAVAKLVGDTFPDAKARTRGNFTARMWAFAGAMQVDDLVVLPRKLTSQIAIGRVTGPYRFTKVNSESRHTRPVQWLKTDIPRTRFEQDHLYSFGAFMTVCNVSRNDAARRVAAVLEGKPDPGPRLLETAIRRTERGIELMREYGACVIADVVTGKLDVREANLLEEIDLPTRPATTGLGSKGKLQSRARQPR